MKLKKQIAALLMAGAMVCSTLPVNVLAVENSNQNAGGLMRTPPAAHSRERLRTPLHRGKHQRRLAPYASSRTRT